MNSTIISRIIGPVFAGLIKKVFVLFLWFLSPLLHAADFSHQWERTLYPVFFDTQAALAEKEMGSSRDLLTFAGFPDTIVMIAFLIGSLIVIAFLITRRLRRKYRNQSDREPQVGQIIDTAPFAFFQILASVQGELRVLYVNPSFEKTMGICLTESRAGIDNFWDMIHPEDRDAFRNRLSIRKDRKSVV